MKKEKTKNPLDTVWLVSSAYDNETKAFLGHNIITNIGTENIDIISMNKENKHSVLAHICKLHNDFLKFKKKESEKKIMKTYFTEFGKIFWKEFTGKLVKEFAEEYWNEKLSDLHLKNINLSEEAVKDKFINEWSIDFSVKWYYIDNHDKIEKAMDHGWANSIFSKKILESTFGLKTEKISLSNFTNDGELNPTTRFVKPELCFSEFELELGDKISEFYDEIYIPAKKAAERIALEKISNKITG